MVTLAGKAKGRKWVSGDTFWRFVPIMRGERRWFVCIICGEDAYEPGPCVERHGIVPCGAVTEYEYRVAVSR